MALFVSKPQAVEAVQWTGKNWSEIEEFAAGKVLQAVFMGDVCSLPLQLLAGKDGAQGYVDVPVGHWIVHQPDDKSDIWPVDPQYFAGKYVVSA